MTDHTPSEPVDILIVEDNPGDIRLTQEAFKSVDSEIRFHTATDGTEAELFFERCRTEDTYVHPDVVLLDLNLPQMDGFAILRMLEEEYDHPPPPVLVLSSSDAEEDITESYDHAANAYLTKPSGPAEYDSMAQAIESFWIDSAQQPPAPT